MSYQIEGVAFALTTKTGNCLIADEMGLGKTIQAIGYINANSGVTTVLVVCPLSLKINWQNELNIWLTRDDVVVQVVHFDMLKKVNPNSIDLLIIDEAHFIKNPKSQRTMAIKALSRKAKHCIMLTGTPVDNRPLELWPLIQILDPKKWDPAGYTSVMVKGKRIKKKVGAGEGANFFGFAKYFCGGVKKTYHKKVGGRVEVKSAWDFTGASNLEELNLELRKSGMIRRLKKDVLTELPPKRHQIIELSCPPEATDEYQASKDWQYNLGYLKSEEAKASDELFLKNIASLKADKVSFSEWSKKRHEQGIAKIDAVAEYVLSCLEEGVEKIILFGYHDKVVTGLAERLVFAGCTYIHSSMNAEERQFAVDMFNDDPNCKVIVGSIHTMGTGYTMTVADLVIFGEVDPVPGRMAQGADRAHRIGQDKRLLVKYLVYNNTIEARICKILVAKQAVIDQVLNINTNSGVTCHDHQP